MDEPNEECNSPEEDNISEFTLCIAKSDTDEDIKDVCKISSDETAVESDKADGNAENFTDELPTNSLVNEKVNSLICEPSADSSETSVRKLSADSLVAHVGSPFRDPPVDENVDSPVLLLSEDSLESFDRKQSSESLVEDTESSYRKQSSDSVSDKNIESPMREHGANSLLNDYVESSVRKQSADTNITILAESHNVCSASKRSKSFINKGTRKSVLKNSARSVSNKNIRHPNTKNFTGGFASKNTEMSFRKQSIDSLDDTNMDSPNCTESSDGLIDELPTNKLSESSHKMSADIESQKDDDFLDECDSAKEEEKSESAVESDEEAKKQLLIELTDFNDSNEDFSLHLEEEKTPENIDDGNDIPDFEEDEESLAKLTTESNILKYSKEESIIKPVTKITSSMLDFVNTDLPNTELSNVDISSLDVDTPIEAIENTQSEASDSDLLDDLSDFVGFDAASTEKSAEKIRILHENQEKLAQSIRRSLLQKQSINTTESDSSNSKIESEKIEENENVNIEENKRVNEEVDDEISQIKNEIERTETNYDVQESAIPTVIYPQPSSNKTATNYVYELAKERNIFEEQVPSGSKRVKKKRKMFGYDDGEIQSTSKRPSLSKEHVEGTPNIVNSLSENKENLIADEKVKDDVLSETEMTVASASPTITDIPKVQDKTKRVMFNISNPLFREPFKYGWKREICYRVLPEGSKGKTAYVTYLNSQGKKFKSIRHIVEHLPVGSPLSMKHFTFSKERIFAPEEESEFEIFRRMKSSCTPDLNESESPNKITDQDPVDVNNMTTIDDQSKLNSKKKSTPKPSKLVGTASDNDNENRVLSTPTSKVKSAKKSKIKSDESGEVPIFETPPGPPSKMSMPKILIRGVGSSSSKSNSLKFKTSSASKSSSQKKPKKVTKSVSDRNAKRKEIAENDVDRMGVRPLENNIASQLPEAKALAPSVPPNQKDIRETPACSLSCPMALGRIPTLQCSTCLDLYHFECCGYDEDRPVHTFLCKTCEWAAKEQNEKRSPTSNYLLAVSESSNSLCLVGGNGDRSASGISKNTKIVDNVTTWLPSSSNIQLSSKNASTRCGAAPALETPTSSLLQGVLELDGRRYIIVPKESIISISPNANATVNTFGEFEQQQQLQLCRQQQLHDVHHENGPISPAASTASRASSTNALPETIPNTFLVNPSNVNSAGVLLVPVLPSGGAVRSPQYYYSDIHNQVGFAGCERNECGITRPLKRKHSSDHDSAYHAKMAKLNTNVGSPSYRSSLTLSNISYLYDPLILCFKYLTVKELLRVSMSCKYLNRIASDSSLWATVRLKNSKITDWAGFAKALRKHGTRRLDMRKMLCPTNADDLETMYNNFFSVIPSVTSLKHIDFMRCSSNVVHTVAKYCPNLAIINALQLKISVLSLENLAKLKYLKELRLRGLPNLTIDYSSGSKLKFSNSNTLHILSLTSIGNLNMSTLEAISECRHLRILELGDCDSLPSNFADVIGKLHNLERLRLENVTNLDPHYSIFHVIKHLKHFKSLELINFEVKVGFDQALATCQNIEEFLLIPLYQHQSATTNKVIVNGLQKISKTLKRFAWGLTTELLKVTGIFVDQYQAKKNDDVASAKSDDTASVKKTHSDSIPILKDLAEGDDTPEVDILSISSLEHKLIKMLPQARIKVLKMPFNLTWRQSLTECFK